MNEVRIEEQNGARRTYILMEAESSRTSLPAAPTKCGVGCGGGGAYDVVAAGGTTGVPPNNPAARKVSSREGCAGVAA